MTDVRFAMRMLARSPLMTLVVVFSLGLGIGANTAIFSLFHQIVLRSLPVRNAQELVLVKSPGEFKSGRNSTNDAGGMDSIFSYKMFRELEKKPQGLAGIAGFRMLSANLAFLNQTVDGSVMVVSGGYFPVLQVQPLMGRLLEPEDDVHGAGRPVVVLSHLYWQNKLGGRSDVLNQPLRVNGHAFTIVGVTPKGFTGTTLGSQPDVFVPIAFKPQMTPKWDGTDKWNDYWVYVFGRLEPGRSREQAEAAMNVTYSPLVQEQATQARLRLDSDTERFKKSKLSLVAGEYGQSSMRDESRTPLLILLAATLLVLLIAIANAANLLLARGAQRAKELAIRTALGASRFGIMRQMLIEAMLLALAGGLTGIIVATWTLDLLFATLGGDGPSEDLTASLNWEVLLFALGVSILTGLLCGLYPAWDAARSTLSSTLRDQANSVSASLGTARVRRMLVCAQVMVSVVLLVPTGLFLKSLVNLMNVDLGIKSENLITFRVAPELNGYKPEQSQAFFERVEEQLGAIPGVRNVSAALVPLIAGNNWGNSLTVEGYSTEPKADTHSMFNIVGSGFLGQMGVPLIAGREFTRADTEAAPKVAIVNERFAKHFFGDQNPIGRKFGLGLGNKVTLNTEIVGVAKDTHYSGVKQKPPKLYYLPWRQSKEIGALNWYVRTALPPEQMIPQIRNAMRSLDPDLPLEGIRTFEEQIRRNIQTDRIVLQLAAAFAVLATLLAMLGLYGVMAYSVTRRTREIGIRIALGAPRERIRSLVFRELLIILGIGLAVGIPASLALARLTESQLFGVKSWDITVVAGAMLALTIAAVAAGYIPARRATRVDPIEALRAE